MESEKKKSSSIKKKSSSIKKKTIEFLKDRKSMSRQISNSTSTYIKKKCADKNNVLDNKIKLQSRIGTDSISGEVFKGCYPLNCKNKIAIKKIPMTYEIKYIDKSENEDVLNNYEVYSELFFLKLSSFLVNKDVVPNLPLIYDKYSCEDDCKFSNPALKNKKKCILVINELADGDLSYILKTIQPDIDTLKIMYFQIYISLYCMRKYFNMYHNDLHYGNVLFRKIKPGGYIKYIIEGIPIVVPNIGYIMILWDFGRSFIPGKIEPHSRSKTNIELMDFERITSMMRDMKKVKYEKEYNALEDDLYNLIKLSKTYNNFVFVYSVLMHHSGINEKDIIAVYDTDKKIKSNDPNINKYLVKNPSKTDPKLIEDMKKMFL